MTTKTKWSWKINLRCHFCQADDDIYYNEAHPLGDSKECDTILIDINGKLTAVLICEACFNSKFKEVESK